MPDSAIFAAGVEPLQYDQQGVALVGIKQMLEFAKPGQSLGVRFVIALREGNLVLRRRPADEFELRPVYADDFQSGGGLGTLRFRQSLDGAASGRDSATRV